VPRHTHRRDFLKTTAALTAGLWATSSLTHAGDDTPDKKLNVAVIGLGGQGAINLNAVSSQNIMALCDVDKVRAGNAPERFKDAKWFDDYRKLFGDPILKDIQGVVISTPDHTHYHPAKLAMEAGKHVYLEKPMAHSVWEVRKLTELAKAKKVATQLGVQRHTLKAVREAVELIRAGAIGDVKECHSWISGNRGMPPVPTDSPPVPDTLKWDLWLGPARERKYSPEYAPYKWRFWWDYGTGETGNWGCHILDIPFWALDLKHPTRVEASGPKADPDRTPKSMTVKYEFPAEGKRGPVTLHWYHGTPAILEKEKLKGSGMNNLFLGSKGMLLCGFSSTKLLPEKDFKDYEAPKPTLPKSPGFHKEWFAACNGAEKATCDFAYSGPLTETVLLGNVAYRAGGGFEWDAPNLKVKGNDEAARYITPKFREGW
jgi:predicted dehydrogenase